MQAIARLKDTVVFLSALDTRVHFSNERPFRCTFFADFVAEKKGAKFLWPH